VLTRGDFNFHIMHIQNDQQKLAQNYASVTKHDANLTRKLSSLIFPTEINENIVGISRPYSLILDIHRINCFHIRMWYLPINQCQDKYILCITSPSFVCIPSILMLYRDIVLCGRERCSTLKFSGGSALSVHWSIKTSWLLSTLLVVSSEKNILTLIHKWYPMLRLMCYNICFIIIPV